MSRLPTPGGDDGNWGTILNDFLLSAHNSDGTLKDIPQNRVTNLTTDLASKSDTADVVAVSNNVSTIQTTLANDVALTHGGGREAISSMSVSGNATINLANANVFVVTLTGATIFSFTGATANKACAFSIYLKQDTSGNRSVTWPSSVKWPGGTVGAASTSASALDIFVFESLDGGTSWYGSLVGNNYI